MPDPSADLFSAWPQHLLPKAALTRLAGALAKAEAGALSHAAIARFIAHYQVNMAEAAEPKPQGYASFNAFFTRALKEGARPLHPDAAWLCPVDGAISQFGAIEGDQIFQAKGHRYSTRALLGGDAALAPPASLSPAGATAAPSAEAFTGGHFATLYLSPRDYHRIHMPCDGVLRRMVHVPGSLYSVNPATAQAIPGLFARNERVVCHFDTPHGPLALVLVGATIVGSMATVWHGVVNPPRPGQVRSWDYAEGQVRLARGAEMGRFLLGSTVVMLMPPGAIAFNPQWQPAGPVKMGEAMGSAPQPH